MVAKKTERNNLYAQLHIALKNKRVTDESYRKWLNEVFSVNSAKDLDEQQLRKAVRTLRSVGWLDGRGRGTTNKTGMGNRPSDKQWSKLAVLSRQLGMNGLNDKALATFVYRIVKIHSPRFLTQQQIRKVIYALQKWIENKEKKAAQNK
ncbi:MAG: regulatory protein GemA [Methylococcales bacterium]